MINEYRKRFLDERDKLIFSQATTGMMSYVQLAKVHKMAESSIRRIVKEQKEKAQDLTMVASCDKIKKSDS